MYSQDRIMTDSVIPTGPKNPSGRPLDNGATRVLPVSLSTPTGPSNNLANPLPRRALSIAPSPNQQVPLSSPRIPEPRPEYIEQEGAEEEEPVQLWLKHSQDFQYKSFLNLISSSTEPHIDKFLIIDYRFKGSFSFLTLLNLDEAYRFIDTFKGSKLYDDDNNNDNNNNKNGIEGLRIEFVKGKAFGGKGSKIERERFETAERLELERRIELERERAITASKILDADGTRYARNDENPRISSSVRNAVQEALQRVQNNKFLDPSSSSSLSTSTSIDEKPVKLFIAMLPDGHRNSNDSWISQLTSIFNSIIPNCLISPFEFSLTLNRTHTNGYVWVQNEFMANLLISTSRIKNLSVDGQIIRIKRDSNMNASFPSSSTRFGEEVTSSNVQIPVNGFREWGQPQRIESSTFSQASTSSRSNRDRNSNIRKSRSRSPIRVSDPIRMDSFASPVLSSSRPSTSKPKSNLKMLPPLPLPLPPTSFESQNLSTNSLKSYTLLTAPISSPPRSISSHSSSKTVGAKGKGKEEEGEGFERIMNINTSFDWISAKDAESLLEGLDLVEAEEKEQEEEEGEIKGVEESRKERKRKEGYRRFLESQICRNGLRETGNEHEQGEGEGKSKEKGKEKELNQQGVEVEKEEGNKNNKKNDKQHYFQLLDMISKFNKRNQNYMNLANVLVKRSELEDSNSSRKRGLIKREEEEEEEEIDPFEMVEIRMDPSGKSKKRRL